MGKSWLFALIIAIGVSSCFQEPTEFQKRTENTLSPFSGADAVQIAGVAVQVTSETAQHLPDRLIFHHVYTAETPDSLGRVAEVIFEYTEYEDEDSARAAVKLERKKVRAKQYQGLAGLGQEAFLESDSVPYYNCVVRKSNKVIIIRLNPIPCTSRRENFLAVVNRLSGKL